MKIDDARLTKLWKQGLSPASMAARLGVTISGVHQAIRRLGLRSAKTAGATVITPSSDTVRIEVGDSNFGI